MCTVTDYLSLCIFDTAGVNFHFDQDKCAVFGWAYHFKMAAPMMRPALCKNFKLGLCFDVIFIHFSQFYSD